MNGMLKEIKSRRRTYLMILALTLASSVSRICLAQGSGETLTPNGIVTNGQLEYRKYCVVCHGVNGKGDGPYASELKTPPGDLTVLAKNNHGKFPSKHVFNVISGQELVAAHGTRDMPIFSLEFARPNEAELGAGGPAIRSQHRINQEINTIVRYVESIQQK
jgi:mono/diheme cytochrome c family protein